MRPPQRPETLFLKSDSWRVLRIMGEFVWGFDNLADVRDGVSIFGSARTLPDDPHYKAAVETARLLAKAGIPVITGGMGSMPGALLGGVLIGLTEAMAGLFFTPSAKSMFAFAILVLVLLFRPQGIMGKKPT